MGVAMAAATTRKEARKRKVVVGGDDPPAGTGDAAMTTERPELIFLQKKIVHNSSGWEVTWRHNGRLHR